MYILSGKGSVAGADLAAYVVAKCQERGVLWDNDLPEYTLDFLTQTPSVSKSIREGKSGDLIAIFNRKLAAVAESHRHYMLLCLTAHQLIPKLDTHLDCVNLWDEVFRRVQGSTDKIAFIGTAECLPDNHHRFITMPDQSERVGDLITSVKRGYARLGESYAAHPKNLVKYIHDYYLGIGIKKFFLACTDLHSCKQHLCELGVPEEDIIDILEIAGDAVVASNHQKYGTEFLDDVSDVRAHFRYKYLDHSDSLHTKSKTEHFLRLLDKTPDPGPSSVDILDIGGSSTGHAVTLASRFSPRPCHITTQDISKSSLDAAKAIYSTLPDITASFIWGNISEFVDEKRYDVVLCLGVLLHISRDTAFENTVQNISNLTAANGIVITRDCLTNSDEKIYMSFGGVIRSERKYTSAFRAAGFELLEESSFYIELPIRRKIKSVIWKKR